MFKDVGFMGKLGLLFEELAVKLDFSKNRIQKYRTWVVNANAARAKDLMDSKLNQYDKAEELITFYAFAPLELREDKKDTIEEILKLANVHESLEESVSLSFEKQFKPPTGYLKWLNNEVANHPINYIRKKGIEHTNRGKRLEANTHVDAVFESKNLLILVEVKFTSDISYDVTFNPHRNQLARTIDVGIEEAEKKGKKLVVLLCTPSEFYHKRSRLYYYKIQEYSDLIKISQDIEWRLVEDIKTHLLKVAWLPLEEVIKIVYQNLSLPELKEAKKFFAERNLIS